MVVSMGRFVREANPISGELPWQMWGRQLRRLGEAVPVEGRYQLTSWTLDAAAGRLRSPWRRQRR